MDTRRFKVVMQSLYGEQQWYIFDSQEKRLTDEGPFWTRQVACERIEEIIMRDMRDGLRAEEEDR